MTTSPLIDLDERPAPFSIKPLGAAGPFPQPPAPRDNRQVLHGIRALLVGIFAALVSILLALLAIGEALTSTRPGTLAEFPMPSKVTLTLQGDPALDYMAHVVLSDGSERDVQLGAYLLDDPARITLHANAPELGSTTCRISLDGVMVTTETAQDGGTATCEWRAS